MNNLLVSLIALGFSIYIYSAPTLKTIYDQHCTQPSDIYEHIPRLRDLAEECSSVIEIGVRNMASTWGIIQGLADSSSDNRSYLGIDLGYPSKETLHLADSLATQSGILFSFWKGNDMDIDLPPVDLLFIDSLHTYCHLTYELEKFSPQVHKYIALHDTSYPWEFFDDNSYWGNYSEYPEHIDRSKRGLWPAVQDFLLTHPDWILHERRTNCHGFTILKRVHPSAISKPAMKILYTSALIPRNYEQRKNEYIHSLQILKNFGFLPNTYVVEAGPPTIFSFFEDYCDHIFYSSSNNVSLRNKGVNEVQSLINFCNFHDIGDDEIVIKLTGRYFFENDSFLRYVEAHPEIDAVVSSRGNASWEEFCLQTGCYAIKGKYFKHWLKTIDLSKLEKEMIDLEWDFTRFIQSIVTQGANVEIKDKIGVTAHIADSHIQYY
jgi:hypothetical protein